jgi:hypothetical protein
VRRNRSLRSAGSPRVDPPFGRETLSTTPSYTAPAYEARSGGHAGYGLAGRAMFSVTLSSAPNLTVAVTLDSDQNRGVHPAEVMQPGTAMGSSAMCRSLRKPWSDRATYTSGTHAPETARYVRPHPGHAVV